MTLPGFEPIPFHPQTHSRWMLYTTIHPKSSHVRFTNSQIKEELCSKSTFVK